MSFADYFARLDLREVAPDETGRLAGLHAGVYDRAWSEDEIVKLLASRGVFALVLWRITWFGQRRLAGFVLMRVVLDEAEVLTIAVDERMRGRGYGRMLLEEALRRLYRERVKTCFLEVDPGNAAAVGLYRSLGFEQAGERPGYYGGRDAALVMRLALG